jgi:hypothetical protein
MFKFSHPPETFSVTKNFKIFSFVKIQGCSCPVKKI